MEDTEIKIKNFSSNDDKVKKSLRYIIQKSDLKKIKLNNKNRRVLFIKNTLIEENDFKILLNQIDPDDVDPLYILILSIYYLEKIIEKGFVINEQNKYNMLWVSFLLSIKYVLCTDTYVSVEHLSNLGGYSLDEYIKIEKQLLENLEWKLEIPKSDLQRLILTIS